MRGGEGEGRPNEGLSTAPSSLLMSLARDPDRFGKRGTAAEYAWKWEGAEQLTQQGPF